MAKQNAKLAHLEKRFHNEFRFEMPKFIIQNDLIHYNQSCGMIHASKLYFTNFLTLILNRFQRLVWVGKPKLLFY